MYCAVPMSNAMCVMKATIHSCSYWLMASTYVPCETPIGDRSRGNALHGFAMRTEVSAVFHNIERNLLSDDVIYPIFLRSFLPLIVYNPLFFKKEALSHYLFYFGA